MPLLLEVPLKQCSNTRKTRFSFDLHIFGKAVASLVDETESLQLSDFQNVVGGCSPLERGEKEKEWKLKIESMKVGTDSK